VSDNPGGYETVRMVGKPLGNLNEVAWKDAVMEGWKLGWYEVTNVIPIVILQRAGTQFSSP